MGSVYVALQAGLNRRVALKVPFHIEHETALKRFVREGETLAKLSHPNVVQVYDAGVENEQAFLAMQLIDGQNLEDLIHQEQPSISQIMEWGIALAHALEYIHSRQVIHRDIKNENIIINQLNQPVLVDFGLSKNDSMTHLTLNEGAFMGTFFYAAPESFEESRLTSTSDIYSLGVVLYRCLTHQFPYSDNSPNAFLHTLFNTQHVTVHTLRPEVPKELSDLIDHCLSKDPARRIQSGKALSAALQNLSLTSIPSLNTHTRTDVPPTASPPTKKNRAWVPIISILVLIAAATAILSINPFSSSVPASSTEVVQEPIPAPIRALMEAQTNEELQAHLVAYRSSAVLTTSDHPESFADPASTYLVVYNADGPITVLGPENEPGQRRDLRSQSMVQEPLENAFAGAAFVWVLLLE